MMNSTINRIIDNLLSGMMPHSSKLKLQDDIKSYISNLYESFRLTKNLLFRNEPVDFYQNYLPLTLVGNGEHIRFNKPDAFLDEYKKIAILGNAGSGKTTLLRYITLQTIDFDSSVPIYIELRHFGNQLLSFEDFISNNITDEFETEIKELFRHGKFLFLFDGYDEINFVEGENTISQIENFITKYNKNNFIITSRPGTNIESLNQFHVYEIAPLNKNDISIYIERLQLSNSKKDIFYQSIDDDLYFHQYLTSPLFLSIYVNYIVSHNDLNIPKKKSIFFRNVIDTLFSKHDAVSKLGFVRNKLSGLNKDELEVVSIILAFRSLITSTNSFSKDILIKELELIKRNQNLSFENDKLIYDLTISVNILIVDGDYYSFPHILLLEYLASLFIARLSANQKSSFYQKILAANKIAISSSLLTFLYELDYQPFLKEFLIPAVDNSRLYSFDKYSDSVIDEFMTRNFKIDNDYHSKRELIQKLKRDLKSNDENELGELFAM